ncbi:MAG: hypothetical protein KOO66_02825 [Bacteroidales bacterium]|nr:hypothetical protein [Bacteroidales bacterium]
MKKSLLIILGLVFIFITSCEYKIVEPIVRELPELPDDPDDPADPISFSAQIEPVFQDKCISCHSITNPVLITGSAYDNLINGGYINTNDPESSELFVKVYLGHPGSNPYTPLELAYLLKWIEEGAENN